MLPKPSFQHAHFLSRGPALETILLVSGEPSWLHIRDTFVFHASFLTVKSQYPLLPSPLPKENNQYLKPYLNWQTPSKVPSASCPGTFPLRMLLGLVAFFLFMKHSLPSVSCRTPKHIPGNNTLVINLCSSFTKYPIYPPRPQISP